MAYPFSSEFLNLDLFITSSTDSNINEATSYLDLGPLYGSNEKDQNLVRTFKDGTLKPDTFSEKRVLGFPPGVCAFLICFNRFHNYIVGELAAINENGRFSQPVLSDIENALRLKMSRASKDQIAAEAMKKYEAALAKRDNDLFQTARLYVTPPRTLLNARITCGMYVNIVLDDYVPTIIGLNRTNSSWNIDPRVSGPQIYSSEGTPMGVGNQVSLEFNLVYRWHAAISARDDKWAQEFAAKVFPGRDMGKISVDEFRQGMWTWAQSINPDPSKRDLDMGRIVRDKVTGKFDDSDLVKLLTESTEDCAGISVRGSC